MVPCRRHLRLAAGCWSGLQIPSSDLFIWEFPKNGGPQNGPNQIMIPIMGTTEKGPLIFETPLLLPSRQRRESSTLLSTTKTISVLGYLSMLYRTLQ